MVFIIGYLADKESVKCERIDFKTCLS